MTTIIDRVQKRIDDRKQWLSRYNYEDDLANRLKDLDDERDLVLKLIKKKKDYESPIQATPEETEALFCDIDAPCPQTVTLINVEDDFLSGLRAEEDKEIEVWFCGDKCRPPKEPEVVPVAKQAWSIRGFFKQVIGCLSQSTTN